MPTNLALIINEPLAPYNMEDVVRWEPASGEVLVKVQSATLNPIDWKVQQGYLNDFLQFPAIFGVDIAGDIEEVGGGVTIFQKGDKVRGAGQFGGPNSKGGFQQYTVSLASTLTNIPSKISYDEAAAVPSALMAGYIALYNIKPYGFGFDRPGQRPETVSKYSKTPLVIIGGSSSVGQYTIQLARISGFSPIITTASLKHSKALQELGAHHVLSRTLSATELHAEIDRITSESIFHIYDCISSFETQHAAIGVLAPNGQLITTVENVVKDIGQGKTSVVVWGVLRKEENVELLEDLYHNRLGGWLEKGYIKPNTVEVLPNGLLGIVDGLARMKKGEVSRSKLIVRPKETPITV